MTRQRNLTSRKTKRSTILHFWNNEERPTTTISRITKILLRTVKYNIAKIKQQSRIEDRPRSDRPRQLTINDRKALSQWIRDNKEITTKELAEKLLQNREGDVSQWTIQCQLQQMSYKSTLPYGTSMLIEKWIDARIQWAIKHREDDWSRTVFTDEI